MNQITLDRHRANKHNMLIGRKVDPNKRKTKQDSSDTSMEAPPKKFANMNVKKKNEKKTEDSIEVDTVEVKEKAEGIEAKQRQNEEDMVTVSKEHMKEMPARFDQRLIENIEIKRKWLNGQTK